MKQILSYVFFLLIPLHILAAPSTELQELLTPEEAAWLEEHPVIRVSNEDDWPPFDFSTNGEAVGLSIDYMRELEKHVGVQFEFVNGYTWNELLQMARDKEIDVMQSIVKTEERSQYLLFAQPFYNTPVVIVVNDGNTTIRKFEDLMGKRIAVIDDYYQENVIRDKYPDMEMVLVQNTAEALKAVSFGQADATLEVLGVVNYEIRKNFLANVKIVGEVNNVDFGNMILHVAVRDDWHLFHSILTKAQGLIPQETLNPIWEKWIYFDPQQQEEFAQAVDLTLEELEWLNDHPIIRYTGDPNWLPFEAFNANGEYIGIVADHLKLIEERLNIQFDRIQTANWTEALALAKNNEVDVISTDTSDTTVSQNFQFTQSYLSNPVVVYMKDNDEFVSNLLELKDKKVGFIKGYGYTNLFKSNYPNIPFQEVENVQEGLEYVSTGQLDAFLCTYALGTFNIDQMGMNNIKIVGKTDINMNLTLAVRKDWEMFQTILNKTIASISLDEHHTILEKWSKSESVIERIDYGLIIKIVLAFLFILGLILLWSWRLKREIALRQKAEDELAQSEAKAWALLESTPDGMVVATQDGTIIMVNNHTGEMFGYTREELIGQNVDILLPHRIRENHKSHIRHFTQNPTSQQIAGDNLKALRKDGSEFPVDVSLSPSVDGDELLITAAIRDVTERKQKEQLIQLNAHVGEILTQTDTIHNSLQKSAESLIEHLDASLVRFWLFNSNTNTLEMTASAGLYTHINGPHSRVQLGHKKVGTIAQNKQSYFNNNIATDPLIDDPDWAVQNNLHGFAGIPLQISGHLVGMMVIFSEYPIFPYQIKTLESISHNIAVAIDRKNSEIQLSKSQQFLEGVIDNSTALIFAKSVDGKYTLVNRKWCSLFDITKDEVIGKTDHDLFPPDEAEQFRNNDLQVIESCEPFQEEESVIVNGEKHTYMSQKFPILDSNGFPIAVCGMSSDVTEMKQLQDDLQEARVAADDANKAKSDFLASMSHEIRTPLNGMVANLELLELTDVNEEQQHTIHNAKFCADTLLGIIGDILDFSKIEAGKMELDVQVIEIHTILKSIHSMILPRALQNNINLHLFIAPDVPNQVHVDSLRLRQIIVNLVGNAIKFTKHGAVLLAVTTTEHNEKPAVRFDIIDSGVGFAPERAAVLFEAFSQEEQSTTRKFGGTGLGLAICRRITDMMEGEIGCKGAPGYGAHFYCTLPLPVEEAARPFNTSGLNGLNVIIIQDDGVDCSELEQNLSDLKVNTHTVSLDVLKDQYLKIETPFQDNRDCIIAVTDRPNHAAWHPMINANPPRHWLLLSHSTKPNMDHTALRNGFAYYQIGEPKWNDVYEFIINAATQSSGNAAKETLSESLTDTITRLKLKKLQAPILVIDDFEMNRNVAQKQLNTFGLASETAINGKDGLDKAKANDYAMIFVDWMMPVMDGIEFANQYRRWEKEVGKHVPVIAMTANALKGDEERCREAGMDDYLSKPVKLERMAEMLSKWLTGTTQELVTPEETKPEREPTEQQTEEVHAEEPQPVDLKHLSEILGEDDPVELAETLDMYKDELENLFASLSTAIESEDRQAVRDTAHKAKGGASYAAAIPLSEICKQMQLTAFDATWDEIHNLMNQAEQEWKSVKEFIESLNQTTEA